MDHTADNDALHRPAADWLGHRGGIARPCLSRHGPTVDRADRRAIHWLAKARWACPCSALAYARTCGADGAASLRPVRAQ